MSSVFAAATTSGDENRSPARRTWTVALLAATGISLAVAAVATRSLLVGAALLESFPAGTGIGMVLIAVWTGLVVLFALSGMTLARWNEGALHGPLVVCVAAAAAVVLVRITFLNASTFQARLSSWQVSVLESTGLAVAAMAVAGLAAASAWHRLIAAGLWTGRRRTLLLEAGWSLALGALVFTGVRWGVETGVNREFAATAAPLLGAAASIAFLVRALTPALVEPTSRSEEPGARHQVVLAYALLPMVPVARYGVLNASEFSAFAQVTLVLGAALLSSVVVVGIPTALVALSRRGLRIHAVAVVPAASMFIILNMASLSNQRQWFGAGQDLLILLLLGTLTLLMALVSRLPRGFALTAVVALLALEILSPWVLPERGTGGGGSVDAAQEEAWADILMSAAEEFTDLPDIYLLMYESYTDEETMGHYGIDNGDQVRFLEDLGFDVVPGTYSNGASTLDSVSRLLAAQSVLSKDVRHYTSGRAAPVRALASAGYETRSVNASGYLFEGIGSTYDRTFPAQEAPASAFRALRTVLRGEFRFEDSFESVDYPEYLTAKRDTLARPSEAPVFLDTINQLPGHSQNSGRCLSGEQEQYAENVDSANEEMRRDVLELGSKLDDAIVVIAGDHGPYLTQNCARIPSNWPSPVNRIDVQDRYGVFLAIKWPTAIENRYDIQVLQDVFPAIFAALADDPTLWGQRPVVVETLTGASGPARAVDGIVVGGIDDGRSLFDHRRSSPR